MSTIDRPADQRAVAVAFMFASVGIMVVTLVMTLFFQSEWSYVVCAAIYAAKIAAERRFGITSPLSIALLVAYAGLVAAESTGADYTGYAGVIIFSWLLIVVGGLLAAGKPFTTFYSHGLGLASVHRTVSVIWLCAYGAALVASLALMPHPLFVVLPALICLAGGASTVFVSFVWCGKENERQLSFKREEFEFAQISQASAEFGEACDFYAKCITSDPQHAEEGKPWQEVSAGVQRAELELGSDSVMFVCRDEGRIVGTVRCVIDRPGRKFSTEEDIASSFDPLRKVGRLMLVGRLAVADEYRSRPAIMTGLFSAVVNLALDRSVSYVISAGFRHVLPVYLKLGFQMMFDKRDRRHGVRLWHGFVAYPVLLDFRTMVLTKASNEEMKFGLYDIASEYIAERWYKRAIVSGFWNRLRGRTLPDSIEHVRALLAEPDVATTANGAAVTAGS